MHFFYIYGGWLVWARDVKSFTLCHHKSNICLILLIKFYDNIFLSLFLKNKTCLISLIISYYDETEFRIFFYIAVCKWFYVKVSTHENLTIYIIRTKKQCPQISLKVLIRLKTNTFCEAFIRWFYLIKCKSVLFLNLFSCHPSFK